MSRLPKVTTRQVIRALEQCGFLVVRSKGSHHRLVHDTDPTRQTTVSDHKGKTIPKGTLRDIIEQAGLTVQSRSAQHAVDRALEIGAGISTRSLQLTVCWQSPKRYHDRARVHACLSGSA